jgi:hypothetical protein
LTIIKNVLYLSNNKTEVFMFEDFDSWMAEVDRLVEAAIGLSTADLSDRAYRDYFDDGLSPREVYREIMDDMEETM